MVGFKRITLAQLEQAYTRGIVGVCDGDRAIVTVGIEDDE